MNFLLGLFRNFSQLIMAQMFHSVVVVIVDQNLQLVAVLVCVGALTNCSKAPCSLNKATTNHNFGPPILILLIFFLRYNRSAMHSNRTLKSTWSYFHIIVQQPFFFLGPLSSPSVTCCTRPGVPSWGMFSRFTVSVVSGFPPFFISPLLLLPLPSLAPLTPLLPGLAKLLLPLA